jgi:hypothetical protein
MEAAAVVMQLHTVQLKTQTLHAAVDAAQL